MALTKVINDLADLNQSDTTNALKGCAGTTAQQPASSSTVDYLIVGGGGSAYGDGGGPGGAGGLLTSTTTVYSGTPTVITVGEGATSPGVNYADTGVPNGEDSVFNGIIAYGGGTGVWRYGAGGGYATVTQSNSGGSGSGGGHNQGLSGTTPAAYSLPGNGISGQGHDGGAAGTDLYTTGGGGGAGAVGATGSSGQSGNGGVGTDYTSFISVVNANLAQIGDTSNGTQVYFAGGGGGGGAQNGGVLPGTGGLGGGGNGSQIQNTAYDGDTNTGGGAGAGNMWGQGSTYSGSAGGSGGSGVVALKYDNTEITGYSLNSGDTATINWPAGAFGRAYWPLNLNVKDIGGNYDGTAEDVTYAIGNFSNAAVFDGSTSNIVVPNIRTAIDNNFSISFWMRTGASLSSQVIIGMYGYAAGAPAGSGYGWSIEYIGGNKFMFYWVYAQSAAAQLDSPALTADTWYHVTVTKDSSSAKLYINGTLEDSSTSNTGLYYGASDPYIIDDITFGGRHLVDGGSLSQPFEGRLEQMRIYTSSLSESNITDIYNNSKPGTLPLLKTASDITTSTCNFPSGVTGTALYQFEGDANDSCTVGPYNGTWTGTTAYGTGKFGTQSANFDGASYINGTVSHGDSFSISAWVYLDSYGYQNFYNAREDSQNLIQIGQDSTCGSCSNGTLAVANKVSNVWTVWYTSSQPFSSLNKWYHVAANFSSSNTKVYVDGVFVESHNCYSSVPNYSEFNIGATNTTSYGGYWDGKVDQLRLYNNVILTDENVYDLWQKENDIQTYFPDTPTSGTDTLVFKSGSGEISFTNDTAPGAEVGMLRYNNTLGQMEHFNSGGWKSLTQSLLIDYLVIAGGGGGATLGGGGGAGGYRTSFGTISGGGNSNESQFNASFNTAYTVTVGTGGALTVDGSYALNGNDGNDSTFATITSKGGGGGCGHSNITANSGGSGGGGASSGNLTYGGSGEPNQGYGGGNGNNVTFYPGAGGGGAGSSGMPGIAGYNASGDGGHGLASNITGSYVTRAGGGGGPGYSNGTLTIGYGGAGGGANGSASNGNAAAANTGGGGGGGGYNNSSGVYEGGGAGGSGIVILRYSAGTLVNNTTGTLNTGVINATIAGSTDKYTTFISGTGNISFT
jgi:hypothetical protein